MEVNDYNNIYDGMNYNTYQQLFSPKPVTKEEQLTPENKNTLNEIEFYTLDKLHKLYYKMLKYVSKLWEAHPANIIYDEEKGVYIYKTLEEEIKFDILSKYYSKDLKKILDSVARYGKCHTHSIIVGSQISDSKIVTGYISTQGDKRILHTVVEAINTFGQTVYIDFTKNLIMTKENYERLTNFVVLNKIPSKTLFEDQEMLNDLNISTKVYLVFRDEINNDLKKRLIK